MPEVSVIVPVYNAEKYLHRCIDSIIEQTFIDFELLLIDDGSKDESGRICDKYAGKDKRVRVFHKKNGGVSSARNVGLDNACGNWIAFVDADDWVKPEYLEHLHSHIKQGDLIIAYAEIYKSDGSHEKEEYPFYIVNDENFDWLFTKSAMSWHTSPWSKLYKRSVIEKSRLRFDEKMHIGEDMVFLYSFINLTKRIVVSTHTDYCYNVESQCSLTKRIYPIKSEFHGLKEIAKLINTFIMERDLTQNAVDELKWLKASYINRVLNSLYHNNSDSKKRIEIIKSLDLDTYINNIHSSSWKMKILNKLLLYKQFFVYDFARFLMISLKTRIHGIRFCYSSYI